MKIFLDTEFTGLHKNTTLISLGMVAENGRTFYAEFNDYDNTQLDHWLTNNVIAKLKYNDRDSFVSMSYDLSIKGECESIEVKGSTSSIKELLEKWLVSFGDVEIWSDCLAYDWVLFCDVFDHAFNIPKNVFYIPFDICTLMYVKNVNPDVNREIFGLNGRDVPDNASKHNALWDAEIIKLCYERMVNM